jgi:hypothetical protein
LCFFLKSCTQPADTLKENCLSLTFHVQKPTAPIESMPRRMRSVVEAQGFWVSY